MQDTNLPARNDSLVGKLLVASTVMQDPLLSRSVSLVVHHDEQHVFAVLLNRPMSSPPAAANLHAATSPGSAESSDRPGGNRLTDVSDGPSESQSLIPAAENPSLEGPAKTIAEATKSLGRIHFGGPLSGPVVAVHGVSKFAEAEAGNGVFLAAQKDLLERLVRQRTSPLRLIVGHMGWTQQQLLEERDAGFWHLIDASSDQVFQEDDELWPAVIRRATSSSMARWLGYVDTPEAHLAN